MDAPRLSRRALQRLLAPDAPPLRSRLVRRWNHTWQVTGRATWYLKAHTKDWYGGDPVVAGGVVQHEATAHRMLRDAGVPAAEVVAASTAPDALLGWPYLVTAAVPGRAVPVALAEAPEAATSILESLGEHLASMHRLTFEHPGYLVDGPPGAPDPNEWLHWLSRAERFVLAVAENLTADGATVDLATRDAVATALLESVPALQEAYRPLRFVHGDCHANAFFVDADDGWRVCGTIDLENSSAGAPVFDFAKLFIELAGHHAASFRWWEPLFAGYGSEPDLELTRLVLAGHAHANFTCFGPRSWPGSRGAILRHLLRARSWSELFALEDIEAGPAPR